MPRIERFAAGHTGVARRLTCRRRARGGPPALLVAALAALLAGGCTGDDPNAYAPPPPPEVIVATPAVRDVVTYMSFTGIIEASESVELRARVQGFLESVNFQPGQRVRAGDLLFVIDKRQYQAEVDRAAADVKAKAASLLGAENDAKLARELADQRAGPEIDAIIKAARRDAIKAELAGADAALAQARLNLEYCDVKAPIDGRVSRNYVDVGNLVGRGEPTMLAEIVQAVPCFVSIDASESDVLRVRRDRAMSDPANEPGQIAPGQWRPCELALSDEDQFRFKGHVDYVDPQLDPDTLTLRVRTRYENEGESLIPGLFAQVRFAMSSQQAMLVPEAALLSDQQGRYALVVNSENVVEAKRTVIGVLDGAMRVVEQGLQKDDRVIVLGLLKARPGAKVTPRVQESAVAGR
jgi:RND family efflux transporter MFP subunit